LIGFSVDQDEVIITVTVRMSIKEFLFRVTEIYTYATKMIGCIDITNKQDLLGSEDTDK